MTRSPALVTPPSGPSTGVAAASRRAVAHFSRASTSAGPAVSSRTSSTPQSADSATSPPSARTATRDEATPVEESSPHSVRAWMRSWRASTRMTSPESPSSRLESSGATTRTWWGSSPSAGSTSVVACRAAVMSTSRMSSPHGAVGRRRRPRTYDATVEVRGQDNRRVIVPTGPAAIRRLTVRTQDGVELAGTAWSARLPGPLPAGRRPLTFVVAHGFTNSTARPSFRRLVGWLRPFGEVRALDFRGHGRSGGRSGTGGDPEVADVDAAVEGARADGAEAVVTVGLSMGGGAVLRQAALGRNRPDAVVSVSAVSRWYVRDTAPMRRVHWLLETTAGRRVGARLVGLRLGEPWVTPPPAPLQVVSAIAPTPLLLVHGDRDEYFPLEHFRTLAQVAGPAGSAWVIPGFGHAETGATAPLVERIGRWASVTIDP